MPESPLDSKEIKPVNPKENQPWIFIGRTDAEALILRLPDTKNWLIENDPDARKDWRQEGKGMTEHEMVRWHHWLKGFEFEETPGDGEGQRSLVCCSPWVTKNQTRLNNNNSVPCSLISPGVTAVVTHTTMKGWVQYSRSTVQMPSILELLSRASFCSQDYACLDWWAVLIGARKSAGSLQCLVPEGKGHSSELPSHTWGLPAPLGHLPGVGSRLLFAPWAGNGKGRWWDPLEHTIQHGDLWLTPKLCFQSHHPQHLLTPNLGSQMCPLEDSSCALKAPIPWWHILGHDYSVLASSTNTPPSNWWETLVPRESFSFLEGLFCEFSGGWKCAGLLPPWTRSCPSGVGRCLPVCSVHTSPTCPLLQVKHQMLVFQGAIANP